MDFSNETFSIEDMAFDLPPTAELDPVEPAVESGGAGPTPGPTPGIAVPETVPSLGYTEAELLWISKLVSNGPTYFFDKLPKIEPDLINDVNNSFYNYCVKKNINPLEYLWDEIPILAALVPIVIIHWRNYQEIYGKDAKEKKEVDKLDRDYENEKASIEDLESEE